jgi:hypothetical protein
VFVNRAHFCPFSIAEQGKIDRAWNMSLLKFRRGAHINHGSVLCQEITNGEAPPLCHVFLPCLTS